MVVLVHTLLILVLGSGIGWMTGRLSSWSTYLSVIAAFIAAGVAMLLNLPLLDATLAPFALACGFRLARRSRH